MSAQPDASIADHTRILSGPDVSWPRDEEPTANLAFDEPTASFDEPLPVTTAASPAKVDDAAPPAPRRAVPESPRPTVAPGLVLRDRYLLQQVIGSGGTSMVYRAQDLRHESAPESTRVIALKLLREELRDDARAIERLKREFAQMQLLAHPGVLKVFDLDVDRGTWFMTMELLEGQSLSMYLRTHREPHPQALEIVKACAEALQFAHERGIVHGDLKPGNVFLTSAGVRLLDFIGAADDIRTDRAATPAYASPQRLAGELPQPSDDIYSLGCLAYELLTGVHPFDRKPSTVARDLGLQPVRINSLSYRQWRALDRALAFDPRDRPPSMRSFLEALTHQEPKAEPKIRSVPSAGAGDGDRVEGIFPVALPAVVLTDPVSVERAPSTTAGSFAPAPEAAREDMPMRERETLVRPMVDVPAAASTLPPVFDAPRRSAVLPVIVALLLAMLAAYLARTELGPQNGSDASATKLEAASGAPNGTRTAATSPSVPQPVSANHTPVSQSAIVPTPARSDASGESNASASATATPQSKPKPAKAKPPPNAVGFQTSRVSVSEKSVAAVIQVKRLGTSTAGRVPVRWRTEKRSALPGEDYEEVASGTLILQEGQRVGAIYVPIINDDLEESDEMFVVELVETRTTAAPDIGLAIVTIRDDDRQLLTAAH